MDTCVMCNRTIPEGRQVCNICEFTIMQKCDRCIYKDMDMCLRCKYWRCARYGKAKRFSNWTKPRSTNGT